jgi:hypothetical protein
MNETIISRREKLTTLLGQVGSWIITPSLKHQKGEAHNLQTLACKFGGGLLRFVCIRFNNPEHAGIQLCFGIFRFHFDFDFIFIARPENEIRNDKRINRYAFSDDKIDYHSWFLGYEGVGLFRKYSFASGSGVSQIELGAHPLFCISLTNFINPNTKHAIVMIQIANVQLSIHSAVDAKSRVPQ